MEKPQVADIRVKVEYAIGDDSIIRTFFLFPAGEWPDDLDLQRDIIRDLLHGKIDEQLDFEYMAETVAVHAGTDTVLKARE